MRLARAYDEAAAGDERALGIPPSRDRDREVPRLQARAGSRLRGAGVPGRQRLRRGVRHAAAVSRDAAVVDLGGLGQRHGARRPARAEPLAGGARRVLRRAGRGRRRRSPGSTRTARALREQFADPEAIEQRARRVVEQMALALQGSLLVRHAPPAVADAFCASRLAGDGGLAYGTLPAERRMRGDHPAPHPGRLSPSMPAFRRVGLAAEHESPEDPDGSEVRVALTPAAVGQLSDHGCDVAVEGGRGRAHGLLRRRLPRRRRRRSCPARSSIATATS